MTLTTFFWPYSGAKKVQLAGNFTDWEARDMISVLDDKWALSVDIGPGEYRYKFFVDGVWCHDTERPSVANDFGTLDNCLVVAEEAVKVVAKKTLEKPRCEIEVERKFQVPSNFHALLLKAGFIMQESTKLSSKELDEDGGEVMEDAYYDTKSFLLMQANHWLRIREGHWQLKYPVGLDKAKKTSVYHETADLESIEEVVDRIMHPKEGSAEIVPISKLQSDETILPFCIIKTKRYYYKNASDVNVVIDVVDKDTKSEFRVGEIEIVVAGTEEVSGAIDTIEKIAEDLGLTTVTEGKLENHLKINKPDIYKLIKQLWKHLGRESL